MKHISIKHIITAVVSTILLILLDQFTKVLAVAHLKDKNPLVLIQNVFELHYLENRGAAFGILQGKKYFFVLITIIFLIALVIIYLKIPQEKKFYFLRIICVLFFAGAVGNFIDRVANNYVVDFFYFSLIDFPIFNVADIYVTVGTFALILLIFFYYKENDFDWLFSKKKEQ